MTRKSRSHRRRNGATLALSGSAQAQITFKASHQFPGGKGDARDEMVQIIARDAKAANVGLDVQVYPGASLFKPNEQWNALVNGQLDISSFPLDYASGKVRAFGATLMPGLVRSHERAQRMNNSPFMKDIKAKIDKAGVVVLADAWLAGARRLQERLHPQARRHQGPEDPLGRADLRGDVAGGRRLDRLDSVATRSTTRCRPASPTPPTPARQLRLVPHLRAGQVHHRARRQRAVVHVRAGADVEEELRPAQQEAAGRADAGRQEVAGVLRQGKPRASTTRWSRCSRTTRSRSSTLTPSRIRCVAQGRAEELLRRVRQGSADGKKLIDEALAVK